VEFQSAINSNVLLTFPLQIYYPVVVLGIIAAGGIFAGTNPSYTPHELTHHIKTSRTNFLITEPEMLSQILDAAETCAVPRSNIWIFDVHSQPLPSGFQSWTKLLTHGEADWHRFDSESECKDTVACRLFSSGTTGLPKAAEISHHNLIAQHTLVYESFPKPYEIRRILPLPMFHAAAVPSTHFTHLRAGDVGLVMRRFDLEAFLNTIEKFNVTDCVMVPPMVVAVVMSPLTRKYSMKSIRQALSGAAPLDKGTQARLSAFLEKDVPFTQVWGMTELSCVATMTYYPENDITGGVGRLIPMLEAKLIDDDGNNITAYNKEGEICIRGPTVIKGYFDNPTANQLSFDNEGFFKTGDIGYCDEKTKLWYIVDRKKVCCSSASTSCNTSSRNYDTDPYSIGIDQSPCFPSRPSRSRSHTSRAPTHRRRRRHRCAKIRERLGTSTSIRCAATFPRGSRPDGGRRQEPCCGEVGEV
jgi:4-coumarate--CoA ligase